MMGSPSGELVVEAIYSCIDSSTSGKDPIGSKAPTVLPGQPSTRMWPQTHVESKVLDELKLEF